MACNCHGPSSAMGFVFEDPAPPQQPPPVDLTLLGPPAWWNPLSSEWLPTQIGRRIGEYGKERATAAAEAVTEEADKLAKQVDALKPDPLRAAQAILGEPSWGYYGPQAAKGLLVLGLVGGTGYLVYRASQKRKRRR